MSPASALAICASRCARSTSRPSASEPPVRVYDTSGTYSDPAAATDIRHGPAELRRPWILARGDVEEIAGREIRPEDNGLKRGEECDVPIVRPRRPQGVARQARRRR